MLVAPANDDGMEYLRDVGRAFIGFSASAGLEPLFQIGEPWWWVPSEGRPHIYDDAARAAFGGSPPEIPTVRASLSSGQQALLDQAGVLLGASTLALREAGQAGAPDGKVMPLFLV